ncbi:MAG: pinensin family lanthipeptide [Luteibaculum sp.]
MKKKLNLKELEVKSFVTKLDKEEIKGGAVNLTIKGCNPSDLAHSLCRTCEFHCWDTY